MSLPAQNQFNAPFGDWFTQMAMLKGEVVPATMNGVTVTVVVDSWDSTTEVNPNGGAVVKTPNQLSMSPADWQAAGGKKGGVIILASGSVRVRNNPDLTQPIIRLDCASPTDQMSR